jgi:hypothetical protein
MRGRVLCDVHKEKVCSIAVNLFRRAGDHLLHFLHRRAQLPHVRQARAPPRT